MENKSNDLAVKPKYDIRNFHVTQKNDLARAIKPAMTTFESKLTRFIMSQVMKGDSDLRTYSVEVGKLPELLNISESQMYYELKGDEEKKLLPLDIRLMSLPCIQVKYGTDKNGVKNRKLFHWYDTCEYMNGKLTLKLSADLKEFLLNVVPYTDCSLVDILSLHSDYEIRLYELLSSWWQKPLSKIPYKFNGVKLESNEVYYTVEELKEYFCATDKYAQDRDFIKRVIAPSVDSVRKVFPVSFRNVKEGRKIVAVVFTIGYQ